MTGKKDHRSYILVIIISAAEPNCHIYIFFSKLRTRMINSLVKHYKITVAMRIDFSLATGT